MQAALIAFVFASFATPPERKEPPSKEEMAAIARRGKDLAEYDAAAWHASDALQMTKPREGTVVRYIARKSDKGWSVAFGRYDEKEKAFLIAYRANPGDKPNTFKVEELMPAVKEKTFFLAADRAIDSALKDFVEHFEGEQRPYNVAVLPAHEGRFWVYLYPAPTKVGIWPLGGDARYLVSADGSKIESKRQLHKSVLENKPPDGDLENNKQVAGVHTHVLDDAPEDTDVFHVLTRKPAVPEVVLTKRFVFQVDPDGSVKYVGKAEEVLEK